MMYVSEPQKDIQMRLKEPQSILPLKEKTWTEFFCIFELINRSKGDENEELEIKMIYLA